MTISSTTYYTDWSAADGVNKEWSYDFQIDSVNDAQVLVRDGEDNSTVEIITSNINLVPVGDGDEGYVVYPVSGSALAVGKQVRIRRIVGLTQTTEIGNEGDFRPQIHEKALDKLTQITQQLSGGVASAVKTSEDGDGFYIEDQLEDRTIVVYKDGKLQSGPLITDIGSSLPIGTTEGTVAAGDDGRFGIATFAAASSANIPADVNRVFVKDRGAWFSAAGSEPAHDLKFQNGGRWFGISERTITPYHAGAVGDGVTNDKDAFRRWWSCVRDGRDYKIPDGDFLVSVTNADLTDIEGANRNYGFLVCDGLRDVKVRGNGRVHFVTSGSTRRAFFMAAKNCSWFVFKGHIYGDLNLQENVPNTEAGIGYGVYLYNCIGGGLIGATFISLIQPWIISGQALSPATLAQVTKRVVVTRCYHLNFEQCTTFGAGVAGLQVINNRFHNMNTGVKLSQSPKDDPAAVDLGKDIIVSGNIMTWDDAFEFAEVFYDPGKSQVPCGIMVQGHHNNVTLSNNIIDLGNCRALTLTPFSDPGAILVLTNTGSVALDDEFQPNKLLIDGNQLIGHPTTYRTALKVTSYYRNIIIRGNECTGLLQVVGTGGNAALKYGQLVVADNDVYRYGTRAAQIALTTGQWDRVVVETNRFKGDPSVLVLGDEDTLFIHTLTTTYMRVANNNLPKGRISNYGEAAISAENVEIVGNTCKGIDLTLTGAKHIDCLANPIRTDATAIKFVLDAPTKANCIVNVAGNSCSGETTQNSATALNLNGGKLRVAGNDFFAGGSAFILDSSVVIYSGEYYGNGAPTQSAYPGVRYIDYSAGANAVYEKNSFSGASGWVKTQLALTGSTGGRPSNPGNGQSYYDTTISKPVWYTGSGWVDATGAPA